MSVCKVAVNLNPKSWFWSRLNTLHFFAKRNEKLYATHPRQTQQLEEVIRNTTTIY